MASGSSAEYEDTYERIQQLQTIWEDNLQCAICLDVYKEPVALECLHSFCKQCLVLMAKTLNSKQIYCPTCRKLTLIYRGGVDGLPRNWYLDDIAEKVKRTQDLLLTCPFQIIAQVMDASGDDSQKIGTTKRIVPCSEHQDVSCNVVLCQQCIGDLCGVVKQTTRDLAVLDRPNRVRVSIKTYMSKKFPGIAKIMEYFSTDVPVLPDLEAKYIIPAKQRSEKSTTGKKRQETLTGTQRKDKKVECNFRSESPTGYWATTSSTDSDESDLIFGTPATTLTRRARQEQPTQQQTRLSYEEFRTQFDRMLNMETSWSDMQLYDWSAELVNMLGNPGLDVLPRRTRATPADLNINQIITEEEIRPTSAARTRRTNANRSNRQPERQIETSETADEPPAVRSTAQVALSATSPSPPSVENLTAAAEPQANIISGETFELDRSSTANSPNEDHVSPNPETSTTTASSSTRLSQSPTRTEVLSTQNHRTLQGPQTHDAITVSESSSTVRPAIRPAASIVDLFLAREPERFTDGVNSAGESSVLSVRQRLRRGAIRKPPNLPTGERKSTHAQTESDKPKRVKKFKKWWRRLQSSELERDVNGEESDHSRGACAAAGMEAASGSDESASRRALRAERMRKYLETMETCERQLQTESASAAANIENTKED